jgi:chorismate mutase/prephenate dehydrogenase
MSLLELREQIDAIDREGIVLLRRRIDIAKQIAQVKKKNRLPILDSEREQSKKAAIRRLAEEQQLSAHIVEEIFHLVLQYTKQEMQSSCRGEE